GRGVRGRTPRRGRAAGRRRTRASDVLPRTRPDHRPVAAWTGATGAVQLLEREYENLRTALRHAVAARDEHEALCLTLSLVWYWQMRDQRIELRNWCRE